MYKLKTYSIASSSFQKTFFCKDFRAQESFQKAGFLRKVSLFLTNEPSRTTLRYGYDAENRLVKKGDVVYNNDKDGNTLREKGAVYLGKDVLGSVRSATIDTGMLEDRYEYDAFGKPYQGDFTKGLNLGYTGKPYDSATGMYNYGYRDYQPVMARFTTPDPIRDGSNWFAYVNNVPVNFIDPWGLKPGDIFSTIEAADIDFANTYNDDSIRNNREYGASVYYNKLKGGFTYTQPTRGSKDSVLSSINPLAPTVAQLHTHGAYDKKYKNNIFSSADKKLADKAKVQAIWQHQMVHY